jgi:hypothetical protein
MSNVNGLIVLSSSSAADSGGTAVTSWLHNVPNSPDRFLLVAIGWSNNTSTITSCYFGTQLMTTYSVAEGLVHNPVYLGTNQGSLQIFGLTAPEVGTFLISAQSNGSRTRCGHAITVAGFGEWIDPDSTSGVNSTQVITMVGTSANDIKIGVIYALTNPTVVSTSGTEIIKTLDATGRYMSSQYGICVSHTNGNLAWTKSSGSGACFATSLRFRPRNLII